MRLARVTTHPIQYNAPWFKLLAQEPSITLHVFYTWEQSQQSEVYDPGFQQTRSWDIPLLEGYDYTFVKNISQNPGSHHFKGIDNPGLIEDIRNWNAEALLVIGWAFKSHLSCLRYFKGKIPVLFRGDSTLLDETKGIKIILRRLFLRYVYSFVDYALYVGGNNKQYFLAHGLRHSQLQYAPHAIDKVRFSEKETEYEEKAETWRALLGIKPKDFVVLYSGKLEDKKNPKFIIELAKHLKGESYKFVFVGNGELQTELKALAAPDPRIIFVDFQNQQNMPVVYRLGSVFVLPSKGPGETWGLAINEAMVCKKPIIASNKVGGAIDLIHGNGIIIDTNDVNAATEYIKKLSTDSKMLDLAGQESNQIIQIFSFENIVSSIVSLLQSLAHNAKN